MQIMLGKRISGVGVLWALGFPWRKAIELHIGPQCLRLLNIYALVAGLLITILLQKIRP